MKKLYISQPMNGRSSRAIAEDRQKVIDKYEADGWEVIDSLINRGPANAIECLGESIKLMNDADMVFMMAGWEKARGCIIEHQVAVSYGKDIKYGEE